jgi:membrane-bound serine protease (ClpP class)
MISHSSNPLYLAAQTPPNTAIFLLTFGVFLIYLELNRPGSILPGILGLLVTLFAIASLLRLSLSSTAVALILFSGALFLLNLLRPQRFGVSLLATLALVMGFCRLVNGPLPKHVSPAAGIACGLTLGMGTSLLTHIAHRARANKAVD